jgi:hypothetical protein
MACKRGNIFPTAIVFVVASHGSLAAGFSSVRWKVHNYMPNNEFHVRCEAKLLPCSQFHLPKGADFDLERPMSAGC